MKWPRGLQFSEPVWFVLVAFFSWLSSGRVFICLLDWTLISHQWGVFWFSFPSTFPLFGNFLFSFRRCLFDSLFLCPYGIFGRLSFSYIYFFGRWSELKEGTAHSQYLAKSSVVVGFFSWWLRVTSCSGISSLKSSSGLDSLIICWPLGLNGFMSFTGHVREKNTTTRLGPRPQRAGLDPGPLYSVQVQWIIPQTRKVMESKPCFLLKSCHF